MAWIRFFLERDPDRIYVAPWVAEVLSFADAPAAPPLYERLVKDDCEVVRHVDAVILVGGTISSGMANEAATAWAWGLPVIDWSRYATPEDVPPDMIPALPEGVML